MAVHAVLPLPLTHGGVEVVGARADDGAMDGMASAISGEDDEVGVVTGLIEAS